MNNATDPQNDGEVEQKLNIVGMVGMIVFYLIIFLAGILANKFVTLKSLLSSPFRTCRR